MCVCVCVCACVCARVCVCVCACVCVCFLLSVDLGMILVQLASLRDVEAVQPTLTKIQQCVQNKQDLKIRNGMIFVEFAYIKRVLMTST